MRIPTEAQPRDLHIGQTRSKCQPLSKPQVTVNESHFPPFVIPTEAKRSGGICSSHQAKEIQTEKPQIFRFTL
jgi:hypothetical protein